MWGISSLGGEIKGESALTEPLQHIDSTEVEVGPKDTWSRQESPGVRMLDALRAGDDLGVLEVCGETTTMSATAMGWSCQGADQILGILEQARQHFPGLSIEPRTRDIGFGLVIDEVRVQDVLPSHEGEQGAAEGPGGPSADLPSAERSVAVWREDYLTPMRLNLPVRITVRHDDLQVHDVTVEFPAALLKRALGIYVDPLEMSLSEVQSAFIAPVGAGYTTRTLALPGVSVAPATEPETEVAPDVTEPRRPRRFRRVLVAALVTLLVVAAGGSWWALRGPGSSHETTSTGASAALTQPAASPSLASPPASAQIAPAVDITSSQAPTVTHANPASTPSRQPNVTLRSEMAFAFNSSRLSAQAKQAIDQVAGQIRNAGLTGKIFVDGYTDNIGSAAYGQVLSQRRADVVSHYLGSQLVGVPVSIVSTGHGEKNPVADNSTSKGRTANRRVTITLPTA
jgi:outer membrane protein OmpA-like peptidoglycan-associated protein